MSCSTASNVKTSDSMIPASRATASAEMMVPDVPIASRPVESLKNAFTGRNMRLAARRAASMDLRSIRPLLKYFSVNSTHPIGKLSSAVGFWSWPKISSVLPPPISSASRKPEFGGKLSVTPLNMRRASSIPDMTSIGWPRARSASWRKAELSCARRNALVPAVRTLETCISCRRWPNRDRHSSALCLAAAVSDPCWSSPSDSRTVSLMRSIIASWPWRSSPTIMWKLLEPRSTAAITSEAVLQSRSSVNGSAGPVLIGLRLVKPCT